MENLTFEQPFVLRSVLKLKNFTRVKMTLWNLESGVWTSQKNLDVQKKNNWSLWNLESGRPKRIWTSKKKLESLESGRPKRIWTSKQNLESLESGVWTSKKTFQRQKYFAHWAKDTVTA